MRKHQGTINLYEYLPAHPWGVLFRPPEAETPVYTTELGRAAQSENEFEKCDVKILGLSTDLVGDHQDWIQDIISVANASLNFPILEDSLRTVSTKYGMLDPSSLDLMHGAMSVMFYVSFRLHHYAPEKDCLDSFLSSSSGA